MPTRWTATTTIVIESAGGNWAQSTMAAGSVTLKPTNHFYHPWGRFSLSANFESTASLTIGTIDIYFNSGDDGGSFEGSASISNKQTYMECFKPQLLDDPPSDQYMVVEFVRMPLSAAKVSLWNGTLVEISAGWVLKCVPFSLTAA